MSRGLLAIVMLGGIVTAAAPAPGQAGETSPASRDPAAAVPDWQARGAAAADYSARHSGRVVVVMVDGKVVFERADNGWAVDRPHPLASGTKSFVGVVAATAVDDGLLTLDELASDTLTEWKNDPRRSKITVRHLLTLSSGLDPSDALLGGRGGGRILGEGASSRDRWLGGTERRRPENNFAEAVKVPTIGEPGAKFDYGPSHFYAFGELLERKLRAKADADPSFTLDTFEAYMRTKLFEPIGLKVFRIGKDSAGKQNLPGGAMLVASEWAKFGQLVLQQGRWPGPGGEMRAVVGWDALGQCFEPSAANPAYGLTWWLPSEGNPELSLVADWPKSELLKRRAAATPKRPVAELDGKPATVWMAAGLGKQRLYVLPQHNMVVVRFAEATAAGRRYDDREFLRPLLDQPAGSKSVVTPR